MQMCFLLLFIFNSFTKEMHVGNGRFGTAVFCENSVTASVDMDISMDIHGYIHGYPRKICGYGLWVWMAKFHMHGKPEKNLTDISYTSQVIANFVPNFVAIARRVNGGG